MRSDTNAQRLACPRCRANNFVGQAQCWQCGGSLPPPESLGLPAAMNRGVQPPFAPGRAPQEYPTPGQTPFAPGGRRARSKTPLIMAGALLTAGFGVLWAFHHAPSVPAASSLPPGMSTAGTEGVLPDGVLPGARDVRLAQPERDEVPASSDPNEAAARRAIQRSIPRLGLPPGTNDDGTVHLRNGDTISREQYEEVQRKLKNNPILGGPPSVPRL